RGGADAKGALVGDEVRLQPRGLREEPRRGFVLRQDEVEALFGYPRDDRVANGPSARGDGAHARTVGAGDRPESKGRKPSALRVASAIAGRSTGERKAMRRGTQRGRNFSLNRRSVSICSPSRPSKLRITHVHACSSSSLRSVRRAAKLRDTSSTVRARPHSTTS